MTVMIPLRSAGVITPNSSTLSLCSIAVTFSPPAQIPTVTVIWSMNFSQATWRVQIYPDAESKGQKINQSKI